MAIQFEAEEPLLSARMKVVIDGKAIGFVESFSVEDVVFWKACVGVSGAGQEIHLVYGKAATQLEAVKSAIEAGITGARFIIDSLEQLSQTMANQG